MWVLKVWGLVVLECDRMWYVNRKSSWQNIWIKQVEK